MAKQTKKQAGAKPQTEGENPEQETPIESSENEAPQEEVASSETDGEQTEDAEGENPEQESSDDGEGDTDPESQPTEVYEQGKAAVVTRFCQGCRDGQTVREDFPVGDIITGAWAESAVQFGWARMLTAEELEELNAAEG